MQRVTAYHIANLSANAIPIREVKAYLKNLKDVDHTLANSKMMDIARARVAICRVNAARCHSCGSKYISTICTQCFMVMYCSDACKIMDHFHGELWCRFKSRTSCCSWGRDNLPLKRCPYDPDSLYTANTAPFFLSSVMTKVDRIYALFCSAYDETYSWMFELGMEELTYNSWLLEDKLEQFGTKYMPESEVSAVMSTVEFYDERKYKGTGLTLHNFFQEIRAMLVRDRVHGAVCHSCASNVLKYVCTGCFLVFYCSRKCKDLDVLHRVYWCRKVNSAPKCCSWGRANMPIKECPFKAENAMNPHPGRPVFRPRIVAEVERMDESRDLYRESA